MMLGECNENVARRIRGEEARSSKRGECPLPVSAPGNDSNDRPEGWG